MKKKKVVKEMKCRTDSQAKQYHCKEDIEV